VFTPDRIDLNGGNSSSRRAVLDFDESVTVQNNGEIEATGYVTVDIATGKTLTSGGPSYVGTEFPSTSATVIKNGAGDVSTNSLRIWGGPTGSSLTVNDGSWS
jgi:hypothetical protein